jgi:hypothetical protein
VGEAEFAQAERPVEQYAFDVRLRALDAVQLAVALGLSRQGPIDHFAATDKTFARLQP